ncbi:MAG TPA: alpha/beta hydrolase [Mycobacteriales bacterium]|nr:alpha/beta hydrolase [Mycobacteriales bacterium]
MREGTGIPMLVIGAQRYYRRIFAPSLREHFEMVFFDSRQWARTPEGFDVGSLTLRDFSDDAEAVRQTTGLERPVVVGHSHHGALAMAYAQDYPEAARGLGLIASNPPLAALEGVESADDFFHRDASPERLAAHEHNQSSRPVHADVQTPQQFIDNYVANDARNWFDFCFDCRALWQGVEVNLEVLYQLFSADGFATWDLEPTDLPTFLALGRYDYLLPYFVWEAPKKRFATLTERLYERSAHTPPYEQPGQFNADLVSWAREKWAPPQ